ncbi:MAG TPA: phosphotransferase [Anaerolineales bacterium]|nr:phosphotransferase [Anaerolineales bacterium]
MSTKTIPLTVAASLYGISETELEPLHGGHFTEVFGFQREGGKYVLRLTPPTEETDAGAQRSILAWMAHLAAHGAFVPEPLRSQNGNLVEVIPSADGEWLAVAFTQAEGTLSEELSLDQLGADQFQMLGRSIGRMHAIARDYVPAHDVSFPQWETGDNLFSHRIRHEHWLNEKQFHVLEQVRSLPKPAEAYGLIHCDLHFGNFFVDLPGGRITLIDFDDTTYGWFVMDIAVLLFDVLVLYTGTDKDQYALNFLRNFLTGYLVEYPLSKFWLEQLPLFLKLLEINVYDTVARFYPNEAGEWTMKFMTGRKERLENDMPYVNLSWEEVLP